MWRRTHPYVQLSKSLDGSTLLEYNMTKGSLKGLGKLSLALLLAASLNGAAFAGVAPVEGAAAAMSPASNAAVVNKLIGMVNNRAAKSLIDTKVTINDGIVIRKSFIKDGKIIIPSEGLYTTARAGNFHPFEGYPITINGKMYRVIFDRYTRDVASNLVMKKGDIVFTNAEKSRGWECTSVGGWSGYGMDDAYSAEFKILKTTGNYYGSSFPVKYGPQIANSLADGTMIKGPIEKTGNITPTKENGLGHIIVGSNTFSTGRSYVTVDKIDAKGNVYVRELATDSTSDVWISATEPVVASYAAGASFMVGKAKVEVKSVGDDCATLAITDETGATETKRLTLAKDPHAWVANQPERESAVIMSKDGKNIVHLNFRKSTPFVDGKVNLIAFTDVVHIENGSEWVSDNRFLVRPDS